MPRTAPSSFTPHEVAVIEAALINAIHKLSLLHAKLDFGNEPVRLDTPFETRSCREALQILGLDKEAELHVPATPGPPQPGR